MKKFALGATTALAALTWLGTPASAQLPGVMPVQSPAPVVSATDPAGVPAGTASYGSYGGSYDTLSGTPGLASSVGAGGPAVGGTRLYAEASYLLMFVDGNGSNFPLATGGPSNGVMGQPGTTTLLSTSTDYDTLSGFKLGVGGLNGATSLGFEANVMVFGRTADGTVLGPVTTSTLARPFLDTVARTPVQNAVVLASPGAFTGSIDAQTSFSAYGAEANPFFRVVQGNSVNFDLITGFRYFAANERLDVYDSRQVLAGGVSAFNGIGIGGGSRLLVEDHVSARNQFYGANIGGRLSYASGPWFLDFTAKVAVGGVHQIVTIDGKTTLVGGGLVGPTTTGGGFLANLANAGSYNTNDFAVLPEANLQVGYQATRWLNVFAGYQVIYLSNMARAADQVNPMIDSSRLATVNTFNARNLTTTAGRVESDDLFLHGFNFGLTITY